MQGIRMTGIQKDFSGKPALKNVDINICQGTVHAIIGENGAGKSTLMNILSGVMKPTSGEIFIDGCKAVLNEPNDACKLGIGMVHQHFMLVPMLKVWQNIILGIEPINKFRKIKKDIAFNQIEKVCKDYGMGLDLNKVVGTLTVGEQQRIEIIKVMVRNAQFIILDEPTAVLTPDEIDNLFRSIQNLKKMGKTIIFISHKIEEVLRIADEISVLRRGELIGTVKTELTNAVELVHMMVCREVHTDGMPLAVEQGEIIFQVKNVNTNQSKSGISLKDISFTVQAGEVLGVAGVDGNGQVELVNVLMGLQKTAGGQIYKDNHDISRLSSSKIRERGVALIAPDRQRQGLILDNSILRNLVLGCENYPNIKTGPFISKKNTTKKAIELVEKYDVRTASLHSSARILSGGNQQKIILARECGLRNTNFIIAVNPTRGLDIGAIEFVYDQLERQKEEGKAMLLISTELSEILRLSDKIAVMFKGKIMDILTRDEATVSRLGMLMAGIQPKMEARNEEAVQ